MGDGGVVRVTSMSQPMSVLVSSESVDWYTPPEYVEMARAVLGEIDLDPASSVTAQICVRAKSFYTVDDDGLKLGWFGNVFLNPPYGKTLGKSNQDVWSRRMVTAYESGEIESGILLVNSTHGYKWYEELWVHFPSCLVRERIRFMRPDGSAGGQAKRGQTFVYFGKNMAQFSSVFGCIGRIVMPD